MKKLKAPAGTDEANVGTERYPVGDDGTVEVPDDVAVTLEGVGGFEVVADIPEAPEGHTIMQSLSGAQSCSFGANSYTTDDKGFVTVPTSMVGDLLSHGFIVAGTPEVAASEVPLAPVPSPAPAPAAETPETKVGE